MKRFIFIGLLISAPAVAQLQTYLLNASFEGEPQDATVPSGWIPCQPGTTPDILPGVWGVYQEAAHGDTYMGLITRENGTWESVGQRLKNVLSPGQCFSMSLSLAHSNTYAGYKQPLKLRIWGGGERCDRDQLLWESPLIEHREWKTYRFDFVPRSSMQYLIIEAYHQEGNFSYRGNVLIDRLSPIKKCIRA